MCTWCMPTTNCVIQEMCILFSNSLTNSGFASHSETDVLTTKVLANLENLHRSNIEITFIRISGHYGTAGHDLLIQSMQQLRLNQIQFCCWSTYVDLRTISTTPCTMHRIRSAVLQLGNLSNRIYTAGPHYWGSWRKQTKFGNIGKQISIGTRSFYTRVFASLSTTSDVFNIRRAKRKVFGEMINDSYEI